MAQKQMDSAKIADDLKHDEAIAGLNVRRVALSTETTGLGPDHRVIEIGCIEMIGRKLTGRTFHCYVNPEREIDVGALAVHGISREFLADEPKFIDVAAEFVDFVSDAELLVHNPEFHVSYTNHELGLQQLPLIEKVASGIVNTLAMARAIRPNLKNSIDALCIDYHLDKSYRQYHGALSDALLVAKIYLALTRNQQEFSTLSLLEQIEMCWAEVQDKGYMGGKWANALVANQNELQKEVKKFHQWEPLKVYLSVARATKPKIEFSLRYQGQHVANLFVDDGPKLHVEKKTAAINEKYFGTDKNQTCFGIGQDGTRPWRDPDAANFRKHFKSLGSKQRGHSPEHRIEAKILEQMAGCTSEKFNGRLKNIQPVLIAGCPFQMPVPISGNTGEPIRKKGNIDIVARRRVGNRTRLSIWELKRPGVTSSAIEQAYIYGVTVLKMLREKEYGHIWYREIFGFNGKMPDRLTIECVVAVSLEDRKKDKYLETLRLFVTNNSLEVEGDTIEIYLANYAEDNDTLTISFERV